MNVNVNKANLRHTLSACTEFMRSEKTLQNTQFNRLHTLIKSQWSSQSPCVYFNVRFDLINYYLFFSSHKPPAVPPPPAKFCCKYTHVLLHPFEVRLFWRSKTPSSSFSVPLVLPHVSGSTEADCSPSLIECYLLSCTISAQAACSDTAGLQFGGGWVSRSDRSAVQKSDCSLNHRPQRPFKWCDN